VLAVPDGKLPAKEHGDANFAGVGRDGVQGHDRLAVAPGGALFLKFE
jgi:hypothetical protein